MRSFLSLRSALDCKYLPFLDLLSTSRDVGVYRWSQSHPGRRWHNNGIVTNLTFLPEALNTKVGLITATDHALPEAQRHTLSQCHDDCYSPLLGLESQVAVYREVAQRVQSSQSLRAAAVWASIHIKARRLTNRLATWSSHFTSQSK